MVDRLPWPQLALPQSGFDVRALDKPNRSLAYLMGRSMLRANEGTLGQFFKENGYDTGMFGNGIWEITFLIVGRSWIY